MSNIVKYKPKIKIWFWWIGNKDIFVVTDEDNRKSIENDLRNDKIIKIEWQTWSCWRFITIQKMWKMNKLDDFIYSQTPKIREVIVKREQELYKLVNHWFGSIEWIKSFLKSNIIKTF